MTAVQEPPLTAEDWPAQHDRLVEELRAVRPGLTREQAHAVLQGLRTLGWAVHPTRRPCTAAPGGADNRAAALCGATATGAYGATLTCSLPPHTGQPWHDNGRTQWQCHGAGGLWLRTEQTP